LLAIFVIRVQVDEEHAGEFFRFKNQQILGIRNYRMNRDFRHEPIIPLHE